MRQMLTTWVMCFNDVLDAAQLHACLCQLLEIGDWRKLGARLRVKHDGLLEAYVPKAFTPQNPACLFSHERLLDQYIAAHPAGRHFTLPRTRAFTQTFPPSCRRDLAPPGFPATIKDLIRRNLPLLSLHVLSFCDATVVNLSWPENLMDSASFKALLENWSLVVAGRSQEVALVFGPYRDVLGELVQKAEEKRTLKTDDAGSCRCRLPGWWPRRNLPPKERRMVYIPKDIYEDFLNEIRDDISRLVDDDQRPRTAISDAEILLAWLSKLHAGGASKPRGVVARNMVNLRHHISSLRDPSGEYLQSLMFPIRSRLSARDVVESVGKITLMHKRTMDRETREDRLLAMAKSLLEDGARGKRVSRAARDSRSAHIDYSSLASLRLLSAADFGPAVLHCGSLESRRYNPPGTLATAYCVQVDARPTESVCRVLGRDSGGHFWMYGQLEPKVWVRLEEELYRLQKCVNSLTSGGSVRFSSGPRTRA
ncbi:hypothetical protein UVI_02034170 [Ustilaginoidea virens]|nr:hypothetical protein UVI_02034170 [Ustilaginoidea virens]